MIGWAMAHLAHPAKPALCSDIQPTMLMRKIIVSHLLVPSCLDYCITNILIIALWKCDQQINGQRYFMLKIMLA